MNQERREIKVAPRTQISMVLELSSCYAWVCCTSLDAPRNFSLVELR